jgi:hypothetical protein
MMARSRHVVSKWVYFTVQMGLMMIFILLEIPLVYRLEHWSGRQFGAAFVVPNLVLSCFATNLLFRFLGLSRAARTVDELRPVPSESTESGGREVVVARLYRPFLMNIGVSYLFFGFLLVFLAFWLIPKNQQTGREVLPVLLGIVFGVGFVCLAIRNQFVVRMDPGGILACPAWLRTYIPWEKIASCDIAIGYNVFGEPATVVPVFKDQRGKELLRLNLSTAPPVDKDRMLKYIQEKLPKNVSGLDEP